MCLECFPNYVKEEYAHKQRIDCPKCGKIVHEDEIKCIIGSKKWKETVNQYSSNEDSKDNSTEDDENFEWKWGAITPLNQQEINYKLRDEEGELVTKEAAEHLAKYKVKWSGWKKIFCGQWKVQQYHKGFLWEQYRVLLELEKWRFWQKPAKVKRIGGPFKNVCKSIEWKAATRISCKKKHDCGHWCKGFRGEKEWLPCLHPDCVEENPDLTTGCDDDTDCTICYIAGVGHFPSIKIDCGHIFHVGCLLSKIKRKWEGPRINLSYIECPSCKATISAPHHPEINKYSKEAIKLEKRIRKIGVERAKAENLIEDEKEVNELEIQDVINKMAFFKWYMCTKPYFGGMQEWGVNPDYNEKELVWGKWIAKKCGGVSNWEKHGQEFIEWKCRYCWNVSRWFWGGNTHFCEPCHARGNRTPIPCPGPPNCKISVPHKSDGNEFPMGCGMCKNMWNVR